MNAAVILFPGSNRERRRCARAAPGDGASARYCLARRSRPAVRNGSGGAARRIFLRRLSAVRRNRGPGADHESGERSRGPRGIGARHLQRLSDSLRGGPAARRSVAQRQSTVHLQVSALAGRERRREVHPRLRARASRHFAIAHGEGNFEADDETLKTIEGKGQAAFRYCDADGKVDKASNPNGSQHNIAGVFNSRFNVLGLMPHPENLIDPLTGGVDGRPLFDALAA